MNISTWVVTDCIVHGILQEIVTATIKLTSSQYLLSLSTVLSVVNWYAWVVILVNAVLCLWVCDQTNEMFVKWTILNWMACIEDFEKNVILK